MLKSFTTLFLLFSVNLAEASILPKNDLYKFDNKMKLANMTPAEFEDAIEQYVRIWAPLAEAHGGQLNAVRNWDDSTVNAFADRHGNEWSIQMFGGLARREEVTLDAFKLVVCHELGHLFAGYHFGYYSGMASEGSADYFATQVCARQTWEGEVALNATFRGNAIPHVRRECDAVWQTENEQNLCYRTAAAGASLSSLFAALNGSQFPQPNTPDMTQASQTLTYHPDAQCRMDTYFQGGLCARRHDLGLIPGYNGVDGANTMAVERIANANSCATTDGYARGIRPRCWFKPLVE